MIVTCEFCGRRIDKRGMPAHIHFKHLSAYLVGFRLNPMVCFFAGMWPPRFQQKQLCAPKNTEAGK